jgi:glucose/arabinose dehydrogenase
LFFGTLLLLEILTSFTLFSILFSPLTYPGVETTSSFGSDSTEEFSASTRPGSPQVFNIDLKADIVFQGLDFPSSFAFLGQDDILVLEKNSGQVRRIVNGSLLPESLLSVNVSKESERGMLGIATTQNNNGTFFIFLYFTESRIGDDNVGNSTAIELPRNRLYRFEWYNNTFSNPKLILDLPATPGPSHNGGKITIGPDNNLYITVGDMNFRQRELFFTRAENFENGGDPDGRAGILRITQDGLPIPNGSIIGNMYPLNLYYAYGIRNSFGIDFDPTTGNLWDTENGPSFGDEINLVEPGFNSGWNKVHGILEIGSGPIGQNMSNKQEQNTLVDFGGRGKYSDPEFTWAHSVGPTALKFFDSEVYGNDYENDMFVGDFHTGSVYHFNLTENRTALELDGILKDKVANSQDELKSTVFGRGFGGITDIEVGPDGYLYILTVYQGGNDCIHRILITSSQVQSGNFPCIFYNSQLQGTIFRVMPKSSEGTSK